jgi:hypothetical protein
MKPALTIVGNDSNGRRRYPGRYKDNDRLRRICHECDYGLDSPEHDRCWVRNELQFL